MTLSPSEYATMHAGYSDDMSMMPPPPPPKHGVDNPPLGLPLMTPSPVDKTRKHSPLTDLIESEKAYVDLLTGVIRKVAAAWSRSNLPPRELDIMFRSVEAVYKTNRALLAKLKEIGENPSSPKALGDLLMRWIDELEQPYMVYADSYCIGFDDWGPVKSNPKLPTVLHAFSATNSPSSSLPQPTQLLDPSLWTLDALFLLPKERLKYYRKLYSRLLKSTTPGRSDHRLLTGALERLNGLLATLDYRANTSVSIAAPPPVPPRVNKQVAAISMDLSTNETLEKSTLSGQFGADSASAVTSARGSFSSRVESLSQETASTSLSGKSSQATLSSVLELEKRLATEKTLDIFTMQPKEIRLQIAPSSLPSAREIRLSAKVLVRFTPSATGVEVVHRHGCVYILSDLLLLCEEIPRDESLARGGQDLHLCYPPLSGKVLFVSEVQGQANALQLSIMRRETLILEADSQLKRDRILSEFQECIAFARSLSKAAQEPISPTPPIIDLQSPPSQPEMQDNSRKRPERALNPRLLPQSQPGNQINDTTLVADRTPTASLLQQNNGFPVMRAQPIHPQLETVQDTRADIIRSPSRNLTSPGNDQGVSYSSAPIYRSSGGYATNSPSFVPGQIVPPMRNLSVQSKSPPFVMPVLDPSGGSDGVDLSSIVQNSSRKNSTLRHHVSMHSLRQQPLQQRPYLQSVPPAPSYHNFTGHHPQPAAQLSNVLSNPPVMSHPPEQSSRRLQKSLSSRSLRAQHQPGQNPLPPVPSLRDDLPRPRRSESQRKDSVGSLSTPMSGPLLLPSMQMGSRSNSVAESSILDPSPPTSPADERKPLGPARSVITAQMKCKVFHQQQHAQWKSLGSANLTLYRQERTNVKQLVVQAGNKERSVLISTIVLTDGVERVGKTGIAIELSDAGGARTGVIYMIQLRNEDSASGFFRSLLEGSDRAA